MSGCSEYRHWLGLRSQWIDPPGNPKSLSGEYTLENGRKAVIPVMNEKNNDLSVLSQDPQAENQSEEMMIDFSTLLPFLIKKLPRIILVGLILAVLVIVWCFTLMPVSYQATEKLYVISGSSSLVDLADLQLGSTLSDDFKQVFFNKEVHEQVRQILKLDYTDEDLEKMIEVSNPTGRILLIKITSKNSEYEALRLVEEYSEAARLFIEERMANRIPTVFEKASLLAFHRGAGLKSVVAFMLGCVLAILVLAGKYLTGGRITERSYIEQYAEMPLLGVFAQAKDSGKSKKAQIA